LFISCSGSIRVPLDPRVEVDLAKVNAPSDSHHRQFLIEYEMFYGTDRPAQINGCLLDLEKSGLDKGGGHARDLRLDEPADFSGDSMNESEVTRIRCA
jgi:hypothetical protein